jgi:erythromycin esterase-like protein
VRTFVTQADPGYLPTLNAVFAAAATVQSNYSRQIAQSTAAILSASDGANAVRQHLIDHRDDYLANFSMATVDWAIQNARVSQQATYYPLGGTAYRDQSMALNLDCILQQNPGAKAVIWAHDYHISRANFAMGSYVGNSHGKDYVALGQIFHAGRYNALNNGRLMVNEATPSFPGSIEYVMHATGLPGFFLDLKRVKSSANLSRAGRLRIASGANWLIGPALYRTIGGIAADGFFLTYQLLDDFDALIFFDHVNQSELLPFN